MRKLLLLVVMALATSATVLPAATMLCADVNTLSQLTVVGMECTIQDKIFSNFQYTGGGAVTADKVLTNVVFQVVGGTDIHGWSFVPDASVGPWVSGFTLSYDIAVAPGNPALWIVKSKDQMNTGDIPNPVTISDVQTGVTPSPLVLTGSTGGETVFSNPYSLKTVHTASTATVPTGFNLLSYEQDWFQTSIPEPVTFVLIGTGLIGLGLLRRKAARKS